MKRIVCLVLIALCLFSVTGCGVNTKTHEQMIADYEKRIEELESKLAAAGVDEDGFVEVYKITYEDTTITSQATAFVSKNEFISITYDEYYDIKKKITYDGSSQFTYQLDKNTRDISLQEGDLVGVRERDYSGDFSFYKTHIKSVTYNIVSVKIISSSEFLVKTDDGTERITSNNFVITYFN